MINSVEQKEKINTYFSDIAKEYDNVYTRKKQNSVRAYIFLSRKKLVLAMLTHEGGRVLDAGCGPGVFIDDFIKHNHEVHGIDISSAMINLAEIKIKEKNYAKKFNFKVGDIENLSFPDGYFDSVLCVGVLEYLKDDVKALKEISRVLKKGGEVIVTVPNIISPLVLIDKAILLIAAFLLKIGLFFLEHFGIKLEVSPKRLSFRTDIVDRYYLPWQLNKRLTQNGFKVREKKFHAFRSAIFSSISDKISLFLIKLLEPLSESVFCWFGINYIVKATKD